jgi:hypothetical protein
MMRLKQTRVLNPSCDLVRRMINVCGTNGTYERCVCVVWGGVTVGLCVRVCVSRKAWREGGGGGGEREREREREREERRGGEERAADNTQLENS